MNESRSWMTNSVCGVHAPLIFQLQRLDSFAWGPDVSSPTSI
jgi:hypothetical protein